MSASLVDFLRRHSLMRLNDGRPPAALSVPEPHDAGTDPQAQAAN
jgi:hypothetical protein